MFVGVRWGGGGAPCGFHLDGVFECLLQKRKMGAAVMEAANPEFQVARKKKGREGS